MARRQIIARREESATGPVVLDIDVGDYPSGTFEVYAETDAPADLIFSGSIDGIVFRESFRIAVAAGVPYQNIFSNAYTYVRIEFGAAGDQLIEIAVGI